MAKPSAIDFVKWILPHSKNKIPGEYPIPYEQIAMAPWQYLLGTRVQLGAPELIASRRWNYPDLSAAQYAEKTKSYVGQMLTDCQGLADGYLTIVTGQKTDVTSAYAYANWCKTKGSDMGAVRSLPLGAALYMTGSSGKDSTIHHVGFIVGHEPSGAVIVEEARGIDYDVMITRFADRPWNRWGLMDAIFEYSATLTMRELPFQMIVSTTSGPLMLRNARITGKVNFEMPKGLPVWAIDKTEVDGIDWFEVICFDSKQFRQGWASSKYLK